jgi:hypothetical protein
VAPRAGYVADHADCDDQDNRAHPNQTAFFGMPMNGITGPLAYDFNCDTMIEKSVPEYPGASCEFCTSTSTMACGPNSTTCGSAGEQATFGCGPRLFCIFCLPGRPCVPHCSLLGCYAQTDTAFNSAVNCGALSTTTTCGTCNAIGANDGTGTANTYTFNVQQQCH